MIFKKTKKCKTRKLILRTIFFSSEIINKKTKKKGTTHHKNK